MDIVNDIDFFLIKNNCKLPNKEKIYKKFEKNLKKDGIVRMSNT